MRRNETRSSFGLYARYGKPLLDYSVACVLVIAGAPLLLLIAAAVRLTSSGPALFVQKRLGREGSVFLAYKFRTMVDRYRVPDTEFFTGEAAEITAVGRWLRRTKLDELPQMFNILRGEMSFIGPRPQLPIQLAELDHNGMKRLRVKPGMTGMAQTHGNVLLSWPERWYYDAKYVDTLSLAVDTWIAFRTIKVLLCGEERLLERPPADGRDG